ncbi:MAG: ABC transporter ATP-binding protein [Chlamydiota bacterium]
MKRVLTFDEVSYAYSEKLVLSDVSFIIEQGEYIGIIGPNGGGKTTLLKLIMGLLKPKSGNILLFDRPPEEALDMISYVPQNLSFDKKFPISVIELVLSGLLSKLPWYGTYSKSQREEAQKAIEMMGLTGLESRALGTLSGGQMQRALISRALVSKPKLLLLDEPTSNIDTHAENEIYNLLQKLSGEITILMVTHDLKTSIEQVDRVLCVQRNVTTFKTQEVCEHFSIGLYHAPLLVESDTNEACCKLQIQKEKDST